MFFLFLTQYKLKSLSFYSLHSPATPQQHIMDRTSTLPFIYLFIYLSYFPKTATHHVWIGHQLYIYLFIYLFIFPSFHFLRFDIHHTFNLVDGSICSSHRMQGQAKSKKIWKWHSGPERERERESRCTCTGQGERGVSDIFG